MVRMLRSRVIAWRTGMGSPDSVERSLRSYLGVLSHANAHRLGEDLQNQCWFWMTE